jgi:hypothetical protein
VRRHYYGSAARVQVPQNVPEIETRLWIEADRRLIQKDDVRLVHQRSHDHEPLLLAARELRYGRFLFLGQTQPFQQLVRALSGDSSGNSEVRRVELEILEDIEAEISVGALGDHTDALPDLHRFGGNVGSRNDRTARRRSNSCRQNPDRCRLPGAVGTEEPEELARLDVQVERVERDYIVRWAQRTGRTECGTRWSSGPALSAPLINLAQGTDLNGSSVSDGSATSCARCQAPIGCQVVLNSTKSRIS